MHECFTEVSSPSTTAIEPVASHEFKDWLGAQSGPVQAWINACGFNDKVGAYILLPNPEQSVDRVITIVADSNDFWTIGALAATLPQATYRIEYTDPNAAHHLKVCVAWGLASYVFDRYKSSSRPSPQLLLDETVDAEEVRRIVTATHLARDLINTPAQDMMPQHLSEQVAILAKTYKASFNEIVGDDLLKENYPAVHSVGRASRNLPRLLDLRWGETQHPKLTLIGKGVCFDSGGLNIKSAAGMRNMKKDMGGSAHAIALAQLVMDAKLPVRLRLLVPAVENAIDGDAYRPGDILNSRAGLKIEIDNTDAEGRVILCDALCEASSENPDLMIDFATLTGAARVAVGTEIACMFCNDEQVADSLREFSNAEDDPVWRLPLHQPYKTLIDTKFADIVNSAGSGYGGAITAALFLEAFVESGLPWVHFDVMAWNIRARPGRPEGGEAMGLRACYEFLKQRYK